MKSKICVVVVVFPKYKTCILLLFGSFSVKSGLFELVQPTLLRASSKQNGNHAVLLCGTFDIELVVLSLRAVIF